MTSGGLFVSLLNSNLYISWEGKKQNWKKASVDVGSVLHRRGLSFLQLFLNASVIWCMLLHRFPQKMFGNSISANEGRLELVG